MTKNMASDHVGAGAPVYLAATMEFVAAEVIVLAGITARDNKKTHTTPTISSWPSTVRNWTSFLAGLAIAQGGVLPNI
jgi:histone H2A